MKTRPEIERLKREWQNDPCWDIENTPGFEDHKDELILFRHCQEAAWESEYFRQRQAQADRLGCSVQTVAYIEGLETRIAWLESMVRDLLTEVF